jgi:hypothetical protein
MRLSNVNQCKHHKDKRLKGDYQDVENGPYCTSKNMPDKILKQIEAEL